MAQKNLEKDKKYYWLKLKNDFFKRHDIRIIEGMPNGKDYVLFYIKLLVESVGHEGELRFSDTIPYNEEMLSTITNTNIDIVRSAVKIFRELDMMEFLEDGTIFMQEVNKMIGHESYYAIKQREHREKKEAEKALESVKCLTMSNGCQSQSNLSREEIDIDIELDIDKEIEDHHLEIVSGKDKVNSTQENDDDDDGVFDRSEIVSAFERAFAPQTVSPVIADDIDYYLTEESMEKDLIIKAIEEASIRNAKSWAYIKKMLDGLLSGGIRTIQAYNNKKREMEASKKANQQKHQPSSSGHKAGEWQPDRPGSKYADIYKN